MFDLAYDFKFDETIKITKDLVYKVENNEELKFDIFYADRSNKYKNETIILIHGSSPMENIKDISIFQSWCKLFATNGFDSVIFNWRLDEDKNDVESLIEYIRTNSEPLGLNRDKVSVMAFSAGAEEGIEQTLESDTGFINKLIVYYGKLNKQILSNKALSSDIDLLIAMAAEDDTFEPNCNDEFLNLAKDKGWQTTKLVHSVGKHGFDAFNPCEETNLIIEKTLDFL